MDLNAALDELLENIDHDIAKAYCEETAEEPEFVANDRAILLEILQEIADGSYGSNG